MSTVSPEQGAASEPYWDLEPAHSGAMLRLERLLFERPGFTLLILQFNDSSYRDRVIGRLDPSGERSTRLSIREAQGDFADLEQRLERAGKHQKPVHVIDLEDWPGGPSRLWQAFNYHRESIADSCRTPLLLWVLNSELKGLMLEAPDFWAWRSGTFDFSRSSAIVQDLPVDSHVDFGAAAEDRRRRIEEIDEYLARRNPAELHHADIRLLLDRGEILKFLGELEEALTSLQAAADGFAQLDDRRSEALANVVIGDVLRLQGRLDEALNVLREALSALEQLNDAPGRALALGRIADVLQTQGHLEEALRIRTEEELPALEKVGDLRGTAIALGHIAGILQMRGQIDEALRLFREDQLPIFEEMGDLHSQAVTRERIADLIQRQGRIDESLKIRIHEVLPVLERLGDSRAGALIRANIGFSLMHQGRIPEARDYLHRALRDAKRLKLPQAEMIHVALRRLESAVG